MLESCRGPGGMEIHDMAAQSGYRRTIPCVAASLAAGIAWLALMAPSAGAQTSQATAPQLEVTAADAEWRAPAAADDVNLLLPTETEAPTPAPQPLGTLGLLLGTLAMVAVAVAGITLTLRSLREDRRLRRRGQGHGHRSPKASAG